LLDEGVNSSEPPLVVQPVSFRDERVQRLVDEVQAHYVVIYGGPDDSPVDAHEFDPPAGRFLLGAVAGVPVAMGGWRLRPDLDARLGAPTAEVKRMLVSPPFRRRGYAALVLRELERTALDAGVAELVLETGTMQPEAIALYEAQGYRPTIRFGHYAESPLSRYFGKRLGA
jgi:GNAT superfamily N-acetyltransferase